MWTQIVLMLHWSCHAVNSRMHRHCRGNGQWISAVWSSTWKWYIKVSKVWSPITMAIHWLIWKSSLRAWNQNQSEQLHAVNSGACCCLGNTTFKLSALGEDSWFIGQFRHFGTNNDYFFILSFKLWTKRNQTRRYRTPKTGHVKLQHDTIANNRRYLLTKTSLIFLSK